jgi:protein-S-isoprenylcysteine O-methyltransferase Ste14
MRQRRRVLTAIASGAGGALIGVLALRYGNVLVARFPLFAFDKSLLAHRVLFVAAALGWLLFGVYWDIAARKAAAAKSAESRGSRALHVFATNAGLVLEFAPIRGLGRFLPASSVIMAAGLAMETIGLVVAIWARRHLGRNWSGEISIKVDHQLIRSGPYRLLRHPIYTGLLAMYVGVALVTCEWLAVVGFTLVAVAYWRKIRLEEANLNVAFGADYDAYRRNTFALVPWLF